jgi:UDP-2-acetamido-2-deoxy-ribo-hexuluronate aminotransferase
VTRSVRVPLTGLVAQHTALEAELMPRVLEVVRAQSFILGEPVRAFEETLSRLLGVNGAVGVASGTDALVLGLKALGVGPGNVVVLPAFGFVATVEAVVLAGARPLFADVSGFVLDRASVEAALSRSPAVAGRVRAIVAVHLFGECAPMRGILALARDADAFVVEDSAQAILATDEGRVAGSMGSLGALSFFPTKNLGSWGDGGAVVSTDWALCDRVRRLRQHGIEGGRSVEIGTNSRLDALQATVLEVKARHLEDWTVRRGQVAEVYRRELASLGGRLRLPALPREGCRHVYHQFVVRTEDPASLARHLEARGIETRRYYPRPLPEEPAYASFAEGARFPRAEAAARESLGLPIYPELTREAQEAVVLGVRSFYGAPP